MGQAAWAATVVMIKSHSIGATARGHPAGDVGEVLSVQVAIAIRRSFRVAQVCLLRTFFAAG